jgi:hypothetical protein
MSKPVSKRVEELQRTPDVHWTENVLLAAYLRYRGIKQVHVEKIRKGKGVFYFQMPQDEWDKLVQEYDNSKELKFEHARVDTVNLTFA